MTHAHHAAGSMAPPVQEGPLDLKDRPVQLQGNGFALWMLQRAGWQLDFDGLPARQGVIAVYPHTSNWDFIVGIFAKWSMGLSVTIWGKDSLFRIPLFGPWLRWMGGVPVNRSAPGGIVADMVRQMRQARDRDDFMWLAVAPEGTRSLGPGWRSGFYRVALEAGVPLALAYLDFGRRRVGVHSCIQLCGDADRDMAEIERRLGPARGCRPEQAAPIKLV
ncbi:MAG: 1-acyl-sn-glycerol-3-phosphate acyltransferase [Rubrivivax sp.]